MENPYPPGRDPVHSVPLRELVEAYLTKRRRPVGKSDKGNIKKAFAFLAELFPDADTATFDGEALEDFQCFLIRKKNLKGEPYCRKYLNKLIGFVRDVFKWGATKKLVSYARANELKLVPAIQYGEALHENPDREAASPEAIIATIRHTKEQQIIDMVILQVLTGMRSGELCNSKAGEIKRKPGMDVWLFEPYHHKNKWKGKKRSIALGTEEQTILEKYLRGKKDGESLFCNLYRYKNKAISPEKYAEHIRKTQKKHGLERFTPYQLRHANGTWISEVLGRDHARAQLGHSSEQMTERYDHADAKKQMAVIEKRKAVGSLIGNVFDFIDVPSKEAPADSHPNIIPFHRPDSYTRK